MPHTTIGNFVLDYQVTVTHTPGFEFDPAVYHIPLSGKGVAKARLLKPRGQIELVAAGSVVSGAGDQNLSLGFVQSLTGSSREVVYQQLPHKFTQSHTAAYPIKDGSGEPWYKDEDGNVEEFAAGSGKKAFRIAVSDEPRFSYPVEWLSGSSKTPINANLIKFHDTFVACLAAQLGDKLFCLHKITWDLWIEGSTTHLAQNMGIRIQGSFPVDSPYAVPPNMKLDGRPANRLTRETFV